jgi:hypothetical protein
MPHEAKTRANDGAPAKARDSGPPGRGGAGSSGVWTRPTDARGRPGGDACSVSERMSRLADGFPCLAGKPGVRPWDCERLDDWASEAGRAPAELYAARFVLNVWDAPRLWRCGRFNFLEALDHWDQKSRAAFGVWAVNPWWPFFERASDFDLPYSDRDTLPPDEV